MSDPLGAPIDPALVEKVAATIAREAPTYYREGLARAVLTAVHDDIAAKALREAADAAGLCRPYFGPHDPQAVARWIRRRADRLYGGARRGS